MARIITAGSGSITPITRDTVNLRIGINATPDNALDVRANVADHLSKFQNNNASGYTSVTFYDSSPTFKCAFGYGNASVGAFYASKAFVALTGTDFVIGDGTTSFVAVDRANASLALVGICDASKQGTVQTTDADRQGLRRWPEERR
jgi:hypothetical protein